MNNYSSAPAQNIIPKVSENTMNLKEQQRRTSIQLLIRESNIGALLFFKSQGFRAIGVIREYYQETNDDAIKMVYRVKQ